MVTRLARGALALRRLPTPTGRAVLALASVLWVASGPLQLAELRVVALMCTFAMLLAIPWLVVPRRVRASVSLHPPRAMAGEHVDVTLSATNEGRLSLWQPLVNVPVAGRDSWLRMPTLAPGERESHELRVDDLTRGVFEVGPAVAVRSDPLGLLRRTVPWGEPTELHVRPRTVTLSSLGSGQVRDLEGVPSDRVSMSDLAFHALREYVRGDDLRHVHWRSSARAGELLVRQYHDSRRNHATIVLDPAMTGYGSVDDYELGVSVAASLIMGAAREGYDVTLSSGREQITGRPAGVVLDATCRVQREADAEPLPAAIARAIRLAPQTSLLFVVTGAAADEATSALVSMPPETRCVVVRTTVGQPPSALRQHGHEVITLGSLAELPTVLAVSS